MKAKFILGMALSFTLGTTAMAATSGKVNVRESLIEYSAKVKTAAFGKSAGAKGLSGQALKEAQNKIVNELQLPASKNSTLSMALADGAKTHQRMDNLATVIAAKKMSVEIAKVDAAQAKSIEQAADASAKLIANSALTGARTSVKELSASELSMVTEALTKLESLPESILTKFDVRERDSYTAILNRHDQLIESGTKGSSEEAFVQAIMEVKKIDKTKALEIVKKLKECV